jgi:linearmycin/streptolysin S transport system ATP-binding protein
MALLAAVGVRKRYGARAALDGIDLAVRAGEIVGFLGPNGAGKTTMLSILATVLAPDAGTVAFDGVPSTAPARHRPAIGLVPQSLALYPRLSVSQNVWHFARMQGLARRAARTACTLVLADVGLLERAHDAAESLSGGMQRRLNLACGLVHRPRILLLDEPTVGVDLESREQLLLQVRRARAAGAAVVYSTHYMEEAERICDRVCLIDRGKLVAEGTVEELIVRAGGRTRVDLTYRGALPDDWAQAMHARAIRVLPAGAADGRVSLELPSHAEIEGVLEHVRANGAHMLDFSLHTANLADAFVTLTGHTWQEPVDG